MDRREFFRRLAAFAGLAAAGLIGLFELAEYVPPSSPNLAATDTLQPASTGQSSASDLGASTTSQATPQVSQASTTTEASQAVPRGYVLLAPLSALNGKSSAYFNHPRYGLSLLLNLGGQWKAFSAVCTHAGCTVQYTGSSIYCPCHAGYFSPVDGAVQSGPLPAPLPEYAVLVQNNNLYVTS